MSFVAKTRNDLLNDIVPRLATIGFTDAQFAGSATRNFIDPITGLLAGLYDEIQGGLPDVYLSQATGASLDALGILVSCFRRMAESDQNYRIRISQAYAGRAGATLSAMLGAMLQLANVRDIAVVPFTQGAGSLTFYLLPIQAPLAASTIAAAKAALVDIAAGGAVTTVTTPTPLYVNLTAIQSWNTAIRSTNAAPGAIAKYIANLPMGQPFILDQAIAAALGADPALLDITFLTLSTTDAAGNITEQLLRNYTPLFDQELQPGTIALN